MAMATTDNGYEWKKKLPQGVIFKPTDEELNLYLRTKSSDGEILPGIINELDIYKYDPKELSGFAIKHTEGRMYFFTPLTNKYENGKKVQRKIYSDEGFWKASQARSNHTDKNGAIIGTKTNLVYYENKGQKKSNGTKTSWLMQEFRLPENHHPRPLFNGTTKELTLCVIYYNGTTKDDDQVAMLKQCNHLIPPQTPNPTLPFSQNFDKSPYTFPIHHNPNYICHNDNSSQDTPNSYSDFVANCVPLQQYQPQITSDIIAIGKGLPIEDPSPKNNTETAIISTMHQDLPPLPYYVAMENLGNFSSISQNSDLDGFDPSIYLNFNNINAYMGDEIGSDIIQNSIADFGPWPSSSYSTMLFTGSCSYGSSADQNKLETNDTPISQGNQNSSSGSQDLQLKMKKIKL
ncbi:PREDICTED: NAC domain-containing protein 72-like [Nicotiana attenuata]|uniref:NAC domain-containing protein 72-like n=1 Tax=Nicotiana attenuata TaxID=49451 RepID=UPI0009058788|nr:PREDICTED: NAC domain-containing protein 72-like [Nicotiana attenuata]